MRVAVCVPVTVIGCIVGMSGFLKSVSPSPLTQRTPHAAEERAQVEWESPENEIKLGKILGLQVENQLRLVRDPLVSDYVGSIGQKLARACRAPFPVTLKLYEGDEVDGYALAGGSLYLSSRLVLAVEDEAELAGVIAHLMAHTCTHDFIRGTTRHELTPALTSLVCLPYGVHHLSRLPERFAQIFPGRYEAEADELAFRYLDQAGYDPSALEASLARVDALDREQPGTVAPSFYSHLQTPERRQLSEKKAHAFARKGQYLVNSSEFDSARPRLQAQAGRHLPFPPFSISLMAVQDSIQAGAPVELAITLTNTSNRGVTLFESETFPYQIVIRDAEGKRLLDSEHDARLQISEQVCRETSGPYFIEAGEKLTSRCVVTDFFDLSKPGVYSIQVLRRGVEYYSVVRSNVIKVSVERRLEHS